MFMPDHSVPPDDHGRVVQFRPRGLPRWRWPAPHRPSGKEGPVDDLAKYERGESDADYRHRMKMNLLALAATILLVIIGIWLAQTMADMQRIQDCVLSGRRNCAPIHVPSAAEVERLR
jgi:hypothetical protein